MQQQVCMAEPNVWYNQQLLASDYLTAAGMKMML